MCPNGVPFRDFTVREPSKTSWRCDSLFHNAHHRVGPFYVPATSGPLGHQYAPHPSHRTSLLILLGEHQGHTTARRVTASRAPCTHRPRTGPKTFWTNPKTQSDPRHDVTHETTASYTNVDRVCPSWVKDGPCVGGSAQHIHVFMWQHRCVIALVGDFHSQDFFPRSPVKMRNNLCFGLSEANTNINER